MMPTKVADNHQNPLSLRHWISLEVSNERFMQLLLTMTA